MSESDKNESTQSDKSPSKGVQHTTNGIMYVLTAPLYLVRELSFSLVSLPRHKLDRLWHVVVILHLMFVIYDIILMAYFRTFDLLFGTPPVLVKIVSLVACYGIFIFIQEKLFETSSKSLEELDIKVESTYTPVEEVEVLEPEKFIQEVRNQPEVSKATESDFGELELFLDGSSDDTFELNGDWDLLDGEPPALESDSPTEGETKKPSDVKEIYKMLLGED